MDSLFDVVYQFLQWLSRISGLTYREINILTYFYLLPAFFIFLLERITKTHYLKIGFVILALVSLIVIPNFETFSDKVFDASVAFLKWFQIFNLNYVQASVIICVFLPLLIIGGLVYFGRKKNQPTL